MKLEHGVSGLIPIRFKLMRPRNWRLLPSHRIRYGQASRASRLCISRKANTQGPACPSTLTPCSEAS